MAWAGKTHKLCHATSFEVADRLFVKTDKPRGSKWGENERPLGSNQQHYYRIERGVDKDTGRPYYDVCLFKQVMARFMQPYAGEAVVYVEPDDSATSKQFMHHVLYMQHFWNEVVDTDGDRRIAPFFGIDKTTWSAKLVFAHTGKAVVMSEALIVSKSSHIPMRQKIRTEEDKAADKAFADKLEPILMLARPALRDYIDDARVHTNRTAYKGGPHVPGCLDLRRRSGLEGWTAIDFEQFQTWCKLYVQDYVNRVGGRGCENYYSRQLVAVQREDFRDKLSEGADKLIAAMRKRIISVYGGNKTGYNNFPLFPLVGTYHETVPFERRPVHWIDPDELTFKEIEE